MQFSSEEWREIPGSSGKFQVSNMGRVRRSPAPSKAHGGMVITHPAGLGSKDVDGYYRYRVNGKKKRVHRLVLEAFVGPCPEGMEGCHNNGDKTDNRLSNLRWDTPRSNMYDRVKHYKVCRRGHEIRGYNDLGGGTLGRCRTCKMAALVLSKNPDRDRESTYAWYYEKYRNK